MLLLDVPELSLLTPPASTKVAVGLGAVTVGVSLLPVIENTSSLVVTCAVPSVTRMLPRLSDTLWPAVRAWVAAALLFRV